MTKIGVLGIFGVGTATWNLCQGTYTASPSILNMTSRVPCIYSTILQFRNLLV